MEMEVDDGGSGGPVGVYVACAAKTGMKKVKVQLEPGLSLDALRGKVSDQLDAWEWAYPADKPVNFDILLHSRPVKTDDDVRKVRSLSMLTVVKKVNNEAEENQKSEKFIADYIVAHKINEQVRACYTGLRRAFHNARFTATVQTLGDSEILETMLGKVPELKNDPVAIGIIQNPLILLNLCDMEALKKLAATKPWLIEAFLCLVSSISNSDPGNMLAQPNFDILNPFEETMDEDDDDDGEGGLRASGSRITREQLSAALSALVGGAGPSGGLAGNPFGNMFSAAPGAPPAAAAAPTPNPVASAGANIQNLMNTLTGAGGGVPGQQPLNSDIVARAVTDALRRLTPEQRNDGLQAIRNMVSNIQEGAAASPASTPASAPAPTPAPAQSLSQQYQSQVRQMRDLGITDERLAVLALRVSEGDVNTAAELIFSGWQGEGSDPMD